MKISNKQLANIAVVQKATGCDINEAEQFVSKTKLNLTEATIQEIKKSFLESSKRKWNVDVNAFDSELLKQVYIIFNVNEKELWINSEFDEKVKQDMLANPDNYSGTIDDYKYIKTALEYNYVDESYMIAEVANRLPIRVYSLKDNSVIDNLSKKDENLLNDVMAKHSKDLYRRYKKNVDGKQQPVYESNNKKWDTNIDVKEQNILKEITFFYNEVTKELWLAEGNDSIVKYRQEFIDDPKAFSGTIDDFKYFVSKLEDNFVNKNYVLAEDEKPIVYALKDDKSLGELTFDDREMINEIMNDDSSLQLAFRHNHRYDNLEESAEVSIQTAKFSLQKGKTEQDAKFDNHFIVVDPDPTIYGVIGKAHIGSDAKYVFISKHPATKKFDRMEFNDFNDASNYAKKVIATLGGTVKIS